MPGISLPDVSRTLSSSSGRHRPSSVSTRAIVLRSGEQGAGRWQSEARDLQADFRAAFGEPAPRVSGVSLSADTDNTGERVEARFGDILFEPSR